MSEPEMQTVRVFVHTAEGSVEQPSFQMPRIDMNSPEFKAQMAERYRKRPERAAALPVDLDGDRYHVGDIGPWKVTPCCGSYVKGVENGVVCRSCFDPMDDFPDGPARLTVDDPAVPPASQTAVRITLPPLPGDAS